MKCDASECESACSGGKCNLECSNSESQLCQQTCAHGRCDIQCTAMSCESSCQGGSCTKFTCTADNCTQSCGANCTNMRCQARECSQTCTKGYCNMYCESSAEMCMMSCPGGNCKMQCNGNWCKRDCFGGGCEKTGSGKEVPSSDKPASTRPPPPTGTGALDMVSVLVLAISAVVSLLCWLLSLFSSFTPPC